MRDLREGLKQAADQLDEARLSPGFDERVLTPRRSRLVFVVAAVAVVVAIGWFVGFRNVETEAPTPIAAKPVPVTPERAHIEPLDQNVTVVRLDDGVRLSGGRARFSVEPADKPWRVEVAHGLVSVLAATFEIDAQTEGLVVLVESGSVEFKPTTGETIVIRAGERLTWPLKPKLQPQAPRIQKPAAPLPDADSIIDEVAVLRRRSQFTSAVELLSAALDRPDFTSATKERLSYELGVVLTDGLKNVDRACTHWSRHLTRFGTGRYEREIEQARERSGCR